MSQNYNLLRLQRHPINNAMHHCTYVATPNLNSTLKCEHVKIQFSDIFLFTPCVVVALRWLFLLQKCNLNLTTPRSTITTRTHTQIMQSLRLLLTRQVRQVRNVIAAQQSTAAAAATSPSSPILPVPTPDGHAAPASPKLVKLVGEIAQLNLLEVSELSTLLKKTLNLPDAPLMPAGGFAAFGPARGAASEDEEEAAPKKVQTAFKVKLLKFDDKQKVALIKEIKNLLEGMNLVQAKKFVESAPTIVKEELSKDEADKLKAALEKVGAVIELE